MNKRAKIRIGDDVAILTDENGWICETNEDLQGLLRMAGGRTTSEYHPNTYEAQAEYMAELFDGEVVSFEKVEFEPDRVY